MFGTRGEVIGVMGTLRLAEVKQEPSETSPRLGKVLDYVRANFENPLSVRELADVAGVSERQLRRRFMRDLGIGVAAFVVKTRIQVASSRLVRGNDALSKIALDVGFCDQCAFTKAFRKALGLTPGEYRRRYTDAS
jgi:transcriptional regulator GlxA family with amidase domain